MRDLARTIMRRERAEFAESEDAFTSFHVANALRDASEAANLNLDCLEQIGAADRLDDWRDTAAELQMEQAGREAPNPKRQASENNQTSSSKPSRDGSRLVIGA